MSTEWTDVGPSPVMVAGSSSPAATLSALLFSVVLSMAAPRPRAARYTAATAFGRLVTAASITPPVTICGIPKCVPIDVPDRSMITLAATTTTRAATARNTSRRRPCAGWMISSSSCSSSEIATASQPSQRRATGTRCSRLAPAPSRTRYGTRTASTATSPAAGRDRAGRGDQADRRHPQGDDPAEDDDPAVQRDAARHHPAETEQGRQVEHVGADDDARADLLLMLGQRRDRRGDLRGVRGQRGHHAQQRLRQPEPLADPLQPGDQQVAGGQADRRGQEEDQELQGHAHVITRGWGSRGRRSPPGAGARSATSRRPPGAACR